MLSNYFLFALTYLVISVIGFILSGPDGFLHDFLVWVNGIWVGFWIAYWIEDIRNNY